MAHRVRPGLESLVARPGPVRGLRLGLVANPASITADLVHASVALGKMREAELVECIQDALGDAFIWIGQSTVEVEVDVRFHRRSIQVRTTEEEET